MAGSCRRLQSDAWECRSRATPPCFGPGPPTLSAFDNVTGSNRKSWHVLFWGCGADTTLENDTPENCRRSVRPDCSLEIAGFQPPLRAAACAPCRADYLITCRSRAGRFASLEATRGCPLVVTPSPCGAWLGITHSFPVLRLHRIHTSFRQQSLAEGPKPLLANEWRCRSPQCVRRVGLAESCHALWQREPSRHSL